MSLEIVTEIISILFIATLIDITLGEPPNRLHPVVLIGRIINFFIKIIKKFMILPINTTGCILFGGSPKVMSIKVAINKIDMISVTISSDMA